MSKFEVIICDPPWHFGDTLKAMKKPVKRAAVSHYSTMTTQELIEVPVRELIEPKGCMLALWVPSTLLWDGMYVMKAWGFTLKQTFIWTKVKKDALKSETDLNLMTRIGMGRLFRQVHEIALIGTAGKSIYNILENNSQRSVAFDENGGHSIKPNTLHQRLEIMFPTANKLELFARRKYDGWTTLGNEIDGKDITVAVNELIKGKKYETE